MSEERDILDDLNDFPVEDYVTESTVDVVRNLLIRAANEIEYLRNEIIWMSGQNEDWEDRGDREF
jgi:hypothetical protein